jgi:feruloyl esterase
MQTRIFVVGLLSAASLLGCDTSKPPAADANAAAAAASGAATCDALATATFANTVVKSASHKAADATNGLPAFCEVTAVISPVPESKITAIYRLPENWSGRMLGLGGGGWAGQIGLVSQRPGALVASVGLTRGYAVAQTDGGHESPNGGDTTWTVNNPAAVTDFSHRAIHETAVLGKEVVSKYYGKPASHNYFQGCSTGGRMAMMETQRYPDDYEGVIAGAPVYSLLVQTSTLVRDRMFRPASAELNAAQLEMVNKAAVAACDEADGLADGVVTNPYACKWEPKSLQCKAGKGSASCLSPTQVRALNSAYATVKSKAGVVGHYGLTRGGEMGWNPFFPTTAAVARNAMNGELGELVPLIFPEAGFKVANFNVELHQAAVHATPFAKEYEATSTDLSAFKARGGKLLMWHGLDDPGPSASATTDYYERAVAQNGADNIRYYAAPGVYHCGGGPGADMVDLLPAMEAWVEEGKAPGQLIAKNTRAGFERPLCEWPKLPKYVSGDPKAAASFACQ